IEWRVRWQTCQCAQRVQLWQVCACCSEYTFRLILQCQAFLVSQCRYPRMQGRRRLNPGRVRRVKRDRLPENGELAQQLVELLPVLAPVVTHARLFIKSQSDNQLTLPSHTVRRTTPGNTASSHGLLRVLEIQSSDGRRRARVSITHRLALRPVSRWPMVWCRQLAAPRVTTSMARVSVRRFSSTRCSNNGSNVSIPEMPGFDAGYGTCLPDEPTGVCCEHTASMVPSTTPASSASRSALLRSGGWI